MEVSISTVNIKSFNSSLLRAIKRNKTNKMQQLRTNPKATLNSFHSQRVFFFSTLLIRTNKTSNWKLNTKISLAQCFIQFTILWILNWSEKLCIYLRKLLAKFVILFLVYKLKMKKLCNNNKKSDNEKRYGIISWLGSLNSL